MNFSIKYWLILLVGLVVSGTGFSQTKKSDDDKRQGEIIMTQDELESFLEKIAKRKRDQLAKQKQRNLGYQQPMQMAHYGNYMMPQNQQPVVLYVQPGVFTQSGMPVQSGTDLNRVYQEIDNMNQKIDGLVSGNDAKTDRKTDTKSSYTGDTLEKKEDDKTAALTPEEVKRFNSLNEELKKYNHKLYFANNSSELSATDKSDIADLTELIKENEDFVVTVINGYASNVGTALYNNKISLDRAEAVKKELIKNGVNVRNITTIHHGIDYKNSAEDARRVEISFMIVK